MLMLPYAFAAIAAPCHAMPPLPYDDATMALFGVSRYAMLAAITLLTLIMLIRHDAADIAAAVDAFCRDTRRHGYAMI